MRIAATADLHFSQQRFSSVYEQLAHVRDEADVLLVAGDLTNYGQTAEIEPLVNAMVRVRLPVIAVLGNHDYESGQEAELVRLMMGSGIKVLDGTSYERDGVGFAGAKGFMGGFGRGVLTAFGEPEIKHFVNSAIAETLKLERGLSELRTPKRVVILHYSPIIATLAGEASEIYPFLGTSRLAEVIDRHGADLVIHGHAHRGTLNGTTPAGIPVHNVAFPLLQAQEPRQAYRTFDL